MPATLAGGALAVFLALIAPLWIAPLFNRFVPLSSTPHAALLPRVRALTERAGIPVGEVLVVDASRQGRYTNAYFSGFGATRRIVLYDTLLQSHTADEVESILGHEIGHWRHHHIVKGLALGTLGAALGLWLLSRLLLGAVGWPPLRITAPGDPASLPLVLLAVFVGGWLSLPVENAISRAFERQADRASLELVGRPAVFIDSEKRLNRDNQSNVAPAIDQFEAAIGQCRAHRFCRVKVSRSRPAGRTTKYRYPLHGMLLKGVVWCDFAREWPRCQAHSVQLAVFDSVDRLGLTDFRTGAANLRNG